MAPGMCSGRDDSGESTSTSVTRRSRYGTDDFGGETRATPGLDVESEAELTPSSSHAALDLRAPRVISFNRVYG